MGRAPCCDKSKVKRGPWSPEEDTKLKDYIEKFGTGGNWIALPQKVGLKRCGKSCRLRWLNYLRPNIKHGDFSEDEDRIICTLFATIGSRWSIIAAQLPGRTDNDIKNYWNTKLKKKLLGLPASQRKSKQQQQQNYTDHNMSALSGFEALHMNPQAFNIDIGMNNYDYSVIKEDQKSSSFLMFSNDDGLEHGFENNDYVSYAGLIEGSQNINMSLFASGSSSNDQETPLEMYNYGEIHDPTSTNISFETRERVVYSYDYNNMH